MSPYERVHYAFDPNSRVGRSDTLGPRRLVLNAMDPKARGVLPWLVAVAFFMQTLDSTILNTALPAMARGLGAGCSR